MDSLTSHLSCGVLSYQRATDVVAIVIFQGEQQPSPVSVQCVNDDGARFVGRVVLWGAAVVVSVGSLSGCQLDVDY